MKYEVGIFGRRHYEYLKSNKPTVVNVMRMNGTLDCYLHNINQTAQEMFERLIKEMSKTEGIDEQLKAADQMMWIQRMNSICNRAEKIVFNELIYN